MRDTLTQLEACKPMVKKLAEKYARPYPGVEFDDLYQAGFLAADKGIREFDPAKGNATSANLSSYLAARVRWAIIDELRSKGPVGRKHGETQAVRLHAGQEGDVSSQAGYDLGAKTDGFEETVSERTAEDHDLLNSFSSRQREIAELLMGGWTARAIARHYHVSSQAIENSKRQLLACLTEQAGPEARKTLRRLANDEVPPYLSPRQREVLTSAANGDTNDETAALLKIGVETIKTHRVNILSILGARNTSHAIAIAMRAGLIS